MYFEDLSPYRYFGEFYREETVNIGWIDAGHSYDVGRCAEPIQDVLWSYCKISIAQSRGLHLCEMCEGDSGARFAERNGERLSLGSSEVRVFSASKRIYAAPTLIYHYVAMHDYRPPVEFVEAMMSTVAPPGAEYFQRLGDCNLEWTETHSWDEKSRSR